MVSDLHLTDTATRSTFDAVSFGRTLETVIRTAASEGARETRLILLGDLFEILKSTRWLENDVRPWEPVTERHVKTVREIVDRILAANTDFFAVLKAIRGAGDNVSVTYVIGNHDWPLNTSMGNSSRARIREQLGLKGDDDLFPESDDDRDYSLLAQHGHQWDKANRYRGKSIAIGDAIVIDVLARLPIVLGTHLGIPPDDPRLRFVHEIDNVIPQTPYRMAKWLADGLEALDAGAGEKLNAALGEIAEDLTHRVAPYETESPIGTWWVSTLKYIADQMGMMRSALKMPEGKSAPPALVKKVAFDLDDSYRNLGVDYRYVVYGHTHIPDFRTVATERGMSYYLNCGTWRRLHRAVDASLEATESSYTSTNAHAFVLIRHPSEQQGGLPGYELRQSYHA